MYSLRQDGSCGSSCFGSLRDNRTGRGADGSNDGSCGISEQDGKADKSGQTGIAEEAVDPCS